ncbi:MAG: hypothetical protein E7187_05055 [Erysipelotrichaceae bacterium]|nr:hypothetical protein [Erysipelotrichaceae bacterium]MBR2745194.1 hypothetical protein [Erysipelotrichaceae bacterium]
MKQNLGELRETGNNVYTDRHGRTLVINRKEKCAYVIDKAHDRLFFILSNRLSIAAIIAILIGTRQPLLGLIAGIAVYGIIYAYYHMYFLKKLEVIEDIDLPEKSTIMDRAMRLSKNRNLAIGSLSRLISVLSIVNMFQTVKDWDAVLSFKDMNQVSIALLSVGMSVFFVFVGSIAFTAYFKKGKE